MARFVPIIIQVTDKDSHRVVQKITNAFKQLPAEADKSARGSSNAFSQHLSADFFAGLGRQAFNAFLQQGKQFITDSVRLAQELQNALLGVGSVAAFKGINKQEATDAVNNLSIVKSGLLSVADASVALKNLLQSGFGLAQSITLIERFGDTAAFGKQAALSYGEAIRSATEGIKNQNSILVDNAGITKNIEVMLRERGFTMQDLSDKVKGLSAREALYKGLLAESAAQLGDSQKLTNTYTGAVAAQDKAYQDLQRSLGQIIITNPSLIESNKIVTEQLNDTTGALFNQGQEAQRTARQMVNAYALVKANFIPLVAFLKNLVVIVGETLGTIITATVGGILRLLENILTGIENTITGVINSAISGVNSIGGVIGLPAIPLRQPSAPANLGAQFFIDRMDRSIRDLNQATRNLAEIEKERMANAKRVTEAGFGNGRGGSSALADRGPERIARAQEIAEGLSAAKDGVKKKAAEHLSELQKIDKASERATMKTLYEMGQRSGFVAGTNQSAAAHNKGSLHPLGRALDFSVRGKTPAQVEQFMADLRAAGFTVFDERTRPPGQKVWGGKHVHAQFPAGGIGTDKGFGPTDFAVRSLMGRMRDVPIEGFPTAPPEGLQPEMRLNTDQEFLRQRRELLGLHKQATEEALRRRAIEAEISDDQIAARRQLINLETDLMKFRMTAADDQITEQRRSLSVKAEELDLLRQTQRVQDEIATGPYNEALRIELALLQDIADFRRRDEDAIKDKNRAQLELADATVYHAVQADAAVLRFLASQRTVTEVIADAKVGVIQATFDLIDRGLDKFTSKLGVIGSLVKELLSGFIRIALSKFFQSLYGGAGASPAGGGGGIGGFLGSLVGGLRGGGGSPQLTGGFAGGPGGGAFFGGFGGLGGGATNAQSAQARALSGIGAGSLFGLGAAGALSVPQSLSSQLASQQGIAAAIHESGHAAAGGAASGALAGGGLTASLGAMLPFLGLSLGTGLGGTSRFGSVLGGAGGLIAGGIGAAFLAPGLFAAGGLLGSMGPLIAGLLTNPFTAVAAGALIVGALLLGRNSARRRDETKREELSQGVISQLKTLLQEAPKMDLGQATAAFEQIRVNYFSEVNQIKDSKTRRIATDWWYKPEHPPQVEWKKIEAAVARGQRNRDIEKRLVPEFAHGGTVPYGNTMFSMMTGLTPIKVRPGEVMIPPGGFGMTVPGVDHGYDSVYTMAPPRTRVLTKSQASSARGFDRGGIVGGGDGGTIVIDSVDVTVQIDAEGLVNAGLKFNSNKKVILNQVRTARLNRELR